MRIFYSSDPIVSYFIIAGERIVLSLSEEQSIGPSTRGQNVEFFRCFSLAFPTKNHVKNSDVRND